MHHGRRILTAALSLLLLCTLCLPAAAEVYLSQPPADWADKDLFKLTVFDVNEGDAMLLECGGEAMMMDGGPNPFREDLKNALLSDEISHTIAKGILSFPSVRTSGEALFPEQYDEKRDMVLDFLTDKILGGILAMNVGEVIANEASAAVKGFASRNPLVGMFVNDNMVAQLAAPIGERVTEFLNGDGRGKLRCALEEEISVMEEKPVAEWVSDTESFERVIVGLYRRLVSKYAGSIASQFHIAEIVEQKVNAMPPEALEALMLSVMKKELNAVIWLGGIIGLLLGFVSVLMNFVNF